MILPVRLLVVWLTFSAAVVAEVSLETTEINRRALSVPMSLLDNAQQLGKFTAGRSLFNQMWVIAPSADDDIDGLGPLYNSISCRACHPANGRGRAPDGPEEK